MKIHFDESDLALLIDGVQAGTMTLFLGAGASVGAKAPKVNALESEGLKTLLAEKFELGDPSKHSIQFIYDAACAKPSRRAVNDFIKQCLVGCTSGWQKVIPGFLWNRIYTTNVDDVLQSAIKLCNKAVQDFEFINYCDPFRTRQRDIDSTQVVALHGSVRKSEHGFVFGSTEYAKAVRDNLSWHIKYSEDFFQGGFLFIGTKLNESDLDTYLAYREELAGQGTKRMNSFLVSPNIDEVVISRMRQRGIQCIEAAAEDFFMFLSEKVVSKKKRSEIESARLPKIARFSSEYNKKAWISFKNQFDLIESNLRPTRPDQEIHDFFYGDEPVWWDIVNDCDALFGSSQAVVRAVQQEKNLVVAVTGASGTGKTATLMRASYELCRLDRTVFYYSDEDAVDVDALIAVLKTVRVDTIIVIDNAAVYIDKVDIAIKELNLMGNETGPQIKFLIAERSNRFRRIESGLSVEPPYVVEMDGLSDRDINALIDKLTEKDKLRELRGKSREEQFKFIQKFSDRQLLVAMKEITTGGNYNQIISREYAELPSELAKKVWFLDAACGIRLH